MSEGHGKDVKLAVSEGNGLEGLSTKEAELKQVEFGFNEVVTEEEPEWKKILKRYFGLVPMVMFVAAIISIGLESEGQRDYVSFGLLIFEINLIVVLSWYSDRNAGNALKEIKALSVPFTMVKRDGKWVTLAQRELVPGDLIQLKGGDVVPADARVVGEGEPMKVDESSLTGESLPVTKRTRDDVLSGSVISQGERELEVTSTGASTFFGKTIELLQASSGDQGHLQQVLNQSAYIMTFLGFAGCICIFVVVLSRGQAGVGAAFIITFVVLAAVVPAGMPVVVTTVLAVGSRELAKEKAIVSRLSAMEELSGMEVLCSDKTGTLTKNELELDKGEIVTWGKHTIDDVLRLAALSAKWQNQDAIDRAITGALDNDESAIAGYTITRFIPFNPVDKRTEVTVTGPAGDTFLTTKGAPHVIMDMLSDARAREEVAIFIDEKAERGLRSLGVAISANGGATWQLVGLVALLDPPRDDCAETLRRAQELGLEVKMITGDQTAIAIETARRLGLGTNIVPASELQHDHALDLASFTDACDGFAGVYPEHKFKIVEALRLKGRLVGMTGDGVNDAPALKKANVGIAVAGATAAAKGAADIILTEPGLSTIITAIIRSRKIFRRLESYIVYRMASSVVIMLFFFFAIIVLKFDFPPWVLIFLSLINDFTVMATSSDNVYCSPTPDIWNMPRVIVLAVVIGTTGFLGSLFLINLAGPNDWNWWHLFDLGFKQGDDGHGDAQVVAAIFLSLAIAIQLNIFASRNPSFFFWFSESTVPPPSIILVVPVALSLLSSTFIAVYWPRGTRLGTGAEMAGIGWGAAGVVWAYQLLWFFITDLAKVVATYVYDQVPNIDIGEALVGGPFLKKSQRTISNRIKGIRQAAKRELILRRRRGSITRTTEGATAPTMSPVLKASEEPGLQKRLLGVEDEVQSLKTMFTTFMKRFDSFESRFESTVGSGAAGSSQIS